MLLHYHINFTVSFCTLTDTAATFNTVTGMNTNSSTEMDEEYEYFISIAVAKMSMKTMTMIGSAVSLINASNRDIDIPKT